MSLCGVMSTKHRRYFVCVYMYAVVFSWYLVRVSVRSGVLGVGVVMHVLHLIDERYVVWCY